MGVFYTPALVELSPNRMAHCKMCLERIKKGNPRLPIGNTQGPEGFVCYKCAEKRINVSIQVLSMEVEYLNGLLEETKQLTKDNLKQIIASNFPECYVKKKRRGRARIKW